MVAHVALRIDPARPGTRVHALIVAARPIGRAVRVDHALGAARDVRVAVRSVRVALACGSPVALRTEGVGAARGWVARVDNFGWHRN